VTLMTPVCDISGYEPEKVEGQSLRISLNS